MLFKLKSIYNFVQRFFLDIWYYHWGMPESHIADFLEDPT